LPAELAMPSRLEGLLSLLIASPMTLLGCTPELLPADTEGSSSGGPSGSSTSSSGVADSSSTSIALTSDGTTSTGPTDTTGEPMTSSTTGEPMTSSSSSSSSSEGGESTSTGGQGNTCERVGDLMEMCWGYYGSYYEYSCSYYINYFIGIGDFACAAAYNEFYACVADLECAEVNMGIYEACEDQWDNVSNTCWGWGGSETFVGEESFGDSGGGFIDPGTGGWASSGGGWATSGGFGTDTGDDGVFFDLPPI
jgi:hypothetical protein